MGIIIQILMTGAEIVSLLHCSCMDPRINQNTGMFIDFGLFLEHMFYVGMFQGPLTHVFYKVLDRKFPGTAMKTIAKKILLDQLIASPFCIVLFFVGMNYLNGERFEESRRELRDKFLTVYAVSSLFHTYPGLFQYLGAC